METSVDRVSRLMSMESNIGESGRTIKEKVLENWNWRMAIIMKEISKRELKLGLERRYLKMGTDMKETI